MHESATASSSRTNPRKDNPALCFSAYHIRQSGRHADAHGPDLSRTLDIINTVTDHVKYFFVKPDAVPGLCFADSLQAASHFSP